jgi:hypothetical protein
MREPCDEYCVGHGLAFALEVKNPQIWVHSDGFDACGVLVHADEASSFFPCLGPDLGVGDLEGLQDSLDDPGAMAEREGVGYTVFWHRPYVLNRGGALGAQVLPKKIRDLCAIDSAPLVRVGLHDRHGDVPVHRSIIVQGHDSPAASWVNSENHMVISFGRLSVSLEQQSDVSTLQPLGADERINRESAQVNGQARSLPTLDVEFPVFSAHDWINHEIVIACHLDDDLMRSGHDVQ